MKPLIVLLVISILSVGVLKFTTGNFNFLYAGRIGMSVMLLFTALGHFMYPEGMVLMVPDFLPSKMDWIYLTAGIEIVAAMGLQIPQLRRLTGGLLIVFFVLVLPANIKSAIDHLDYQNATYTGIGPVYLWFRIPLQMVFIAWVYLTTLRIP